MIIKRRLFGLILGITAFIFLPYYTIRFLHSKFPFVLLRLIEDDVIEAIYKTDCLSIISTWVVGVLILFVISLILFVVIGITIVKIIPWLKGENNEDYYM